jgi:hypothetical protein
MVISCELRLESRQSSLGARIFYRTAFSLAFYHPHILELREVFKFDYLLLQLELPIPSWEVRSMQKIVLDSRWCTFGWFRSLASELLDYAYDLYRNVYVVDVPFGQIERLDAMQRNREDFMDMCDNGCGGANANGQYFELVFDPFKLSIIEWSEQDLDRAIKDMGEIERLWYLELRCIGSMSVCSRNLRRSYNNNDCFRLLVTDSSLPVPTQNPRQPHETDVFWYLETCMHEAICNHETTRLQELLQIDYFFWPENAPFKISPRLLVAAAVQDDMDALYLLFQVDPTSMPRSDRYIRQLAVYLRLESRDMKLQRYRARRNRREARARGLEYSLAAINMRHKSTTGKNIRNRWAKPLHIMCELDV